MMNVCKHCGMYRADKTIDPTGPYAICPECGHAHQFRQMPLLIVSGASGTGKTTVCDRLIGVYQDAVLLDSDILWRDEFNQPQDNHNGYFDMWLRVCKNISQSGRPVVLFGAGMGVPDNLEHCTERRYFTDIRYLALVCESDTLAQRLRARPAWRGTQNDAYITEHQRYNQWFKTYVAEKNEPPITLLSTENRTLDETVRDVAAWIRVNQV